MPTFYYQIVTGLQCALPVHNGFKKRLSLQNSYPIANQTLTVISLATPLKCHTFAALKKAKTTTV
jgi:hypothetical protein